MKHKKTVLIFLLLFASILVSAVMRADFPNTSSLQPIPSNVHPNISNNINYNSQNQNSTSKDMQQILVDTAPTASNTKSVIGEATDYFFIGILSLFVVLIFFVLLVWFKNTKNRNE